MDATKTATYTTVVADKVQREDLSGALVESIDSVVTAPGKLADDAKLVVAFQQGYNLGSKHREEAVRIELEFSHTSLIDEAYQRGYDEADAMANAFVDQKDITNHAGLVSRIQCIRLWRAIFGEGLQESKEVVDHIPRVKDHFIRFTDFIDMVDKRKRLQSALSR